jgi:hypothetical protein
VKIDQRKNKSLEVLNQEVKYFEAFGVLAVVDFHQGADLGSLKNKT